MTEKILIDALKNIASYSNGDGICPYGCDTPYIAIKALVDYENDLIKNKGIIMETKCTFNKKAYSKGLDKYFCHNNKTLQTKIMSLDRWFHALIQSKEIVIHAVESTNEWGTVVIWSDNKGYSYSYKDSHGQGTSGVYKSIIDCINEL